MNRSLYPILFFLLPCLFWLPGATTARADEEYVLGPEDVVSLTVWEHPELSRTVVVRAEGSISLPPLGDIPAAGKTTSVLARDLEARYYNVLRLSTQVTVSVVAFNSRKVYLAGQVTTPGKYSFESIPNLVDLLGMAGGLNPMADISRVRVLRKEAGASQTLTVDLSKAVESGDVTGVPALQPGDVVFVPAATVGQASGGSVIYLAGEVARPGPYNALPGIDLLRLISMAGGVTARGDLKRVEIVANGGPGEDYRLRVDLNQQLREGRSGPPLKAGDAVLIPARQAGPGLQAWGVFRETLGVSRDVVNLFLIRNVLQ